MRLAGRDEGVLEGLVAAMVVRQDSRTIYADIRETSMVVDRLEINEQLKSIRTTPQKQSLCLSRTK